MGRVLRFVGIALAVGIARAQESELWVIEGAGHMLPITRPEALAERIAAL